MQSIRLRPSTRSSLSWTTIRGVNRNPSPASINERYAPRASLRALIEQKRFACGVPFDGDRIVEAMRYAGNVSFDKDNDKVKNTGLETEESCWAPLLRDVPITFLCEIVSMLRLGTHILFLGEVNSIRVRQDVTPDNPLTWFPYPEVRVSADEQQISRT